MSEKEKSIISKIMQAVPKMSEFDKGYLLGFSESRLSEKKEGEKDEQFADLQQPGVWGNQDSNH